MWLRGFTFGYRIHGANDSLCKMSLSKAAAHRRNQQLRALVGYYQHVADLPGHLSLYEILRERSLLPADIFGRFYIESPARILIRKFVYKFAAY
jgi:hypothetical protein